VNTYLTSHFDPIIFKKNEKSCGINIKVALSIPRTFQVGGGIYRGIEKVHMNQPIMQDFLCI
jgi:hypothetical protein